MTDLKPNPSPPATGAKKILIVDDDYEIVDSLRYALEDQGYTVIIARDGNQGLALAEREEPDLMILDMMMPKRSGFLVLEKLRRTRETLLPVIMITGQRQDEIDRVVGLELGSTIAFAVVTESIFAWPGMGKLIIDSIQRLDRPVIVAYLCIIVFMFVIINLVVDILYSVLDPRVRLSEARG
jgi:CheY-like chemotaxis protein